MPGHVAHDRQLATTEAVRALGVVAILESGRQHASTCTCGV